MVCSIRCFNLPTENSTEVAFVDKLAIRAQGFLIILYFPYFIIFSKYFSGKPLFAVLKLRGNYLQEVDHLRSSVSRLGLQANSCLAEQERRIIKLRLLQSYQEKCRDTLGKASRTLESLNAAFR